VKFKLDENRPVSSAAILTSVGHDVDTVADEGLVGSPARDVSRVPACSDQAVSIRTTNPARRC
jgi:hypothetical protein